MRYEALKPRVGFRSVFNLTYLVVLGITWTGCITQPTDPEQTVEPASDVIDTVMVTPSEVELYPGDRVQFAAVAILESGEETTVEFAWEATGGAVDDAGMYTAGTQHGDFHVEARGRGQEKGRGYGRGGRAAVKVKERPGNEAPPEAPNQAPDPAFDTSCEELACSFDASSSTDADGTIVEYAWSFGDGSGTAGKAVSHSYDGEGTYDVQVTVTDDAGGASSVTHAITVTTVPANQAPTAAFEYTCDGTTCSFDASTSADSDGSIAAWTWELGDGGTADGQQIEHTYGAAGSYDVRLAVTDDEDATDSHTRTVTLEDGGDPPEDPPGDPLDTTIYPGEDIQAAVDANAAGTSFLIKAGIHRLQSVEPKAGDEFIGESGAILSGARLLTNFQRDGGLRVATGQTQQNPRHGPNVFGDEVCASDAPMCIYPEDLFFDDVPLEQVSSLAQVGPGTFYFDYAGDRIYFWDDPNGHKVEASATMRAFYGNIDHGLTVRGLTIEKYANPGQTGALASVNAHDVVFENNVVRWNHGIGLSLCCGDRGRIAENEIYGNGQMGMGSYGADDLVVERNEIYQNGWAGYRTSWEVGGVKIVLSNRLLFADNHVHHNHGKGVWTDIDNRNGVIERNLIENNDEHGIHHEVGYAMVIRNNEIRNNGTHGIVVTSSSDVEIYGNTVSGNGWNIITPGDRWWQIFGRQLHENAEGRFGPYELENLWVHDNYVTGGVGLTAANAASGDGSYYTSRNNRFDRNHYDLTSAGASPFYWQFGDRAEAEWQAAGNDVNGTFER